MDGFKASFEPSTDWNVMDSCSTVMMGKMWIFGGYGGGELKRQLLSVDDCQLKTEGTLPFDLYMGAANTIDELYGGQTALLCFDFNSPTVCHT